MKRIAYGRVYGGMAFHVHPSSSHLGSPARISRSGRLLLPLRANLEICTNFLCCLLLWLTIQLHPELRFLCVCYVNTKTIIGGLCALSNGICFCVSGFF